MKEEVLYTFEHVEDIAVELVKVLDIQPMGGYSDGTNTEITTPIVDQVNELAWWFSPSGKWGKVFYMHTEGNCNELVGAWILVRNEVT
jgi:hypothetical protein